MDLASSDKIVAIMQPTYLPWAGYFDLIDRVQEFVFLDTVQFEKQSWQQRNQLRAAGGLEWITVPVRRKGRFGQSIMDVEIHPGGFADKHIKQIRQNYRRAPYFDAYFDELADVLRKGDRTRSLCELNLILIEWLCQKMALRYQFHRASRIHASGKRCRLLINILNRLDAGGYLSPLGSLDYMREDFRMFSGNGIRVAFQHYVPVPYRQVYDPFLPFASVVDLLFNEGERSLDIVRAGSKEPLPMEELIQCAP